MFSYILIIGLSLAAGLIFYSILTKALPLSSKLDAGQPVELARIERKRLTKVERVRRKEEDRFGRDKTLLRMAEFVSRLVPITSEARERDREWLVYSGVKMPVSALWALRVVSVVVAAFVGAMVAASLADPVRSVSAFVLCLILGSQVATLYVFYRRVVWRNRLGEQLPDALDLMTVAVSSGTTFEVALRVVSERMDGALAEAFGDIVEESRYGSRNKALMDFAGRSKVMSIQIFAASLAQAEAAGSPLIDILKEQADTARLMRRLTLEQKANSLQVKMLMPMLGFVFPILVIILCAPLIGQVMSMLA